MERFIRIHARFQVPPVSRLSESLSETQDCAPILGPRWLHTHCLVDLQILSSDSQLRSLAREESEDDGRQNCDEN